MGTKMYSRFQNILFTTPWNMSPKTSRFHFKHYVSLKDWRPPNLVFYQNICNCIDLYQMKSDSKIIELGYTTRRTSDDAFEFFKLISNFFLSYCYFARYATKCNMRLNISRNFARVDNISGHYRYNNTLFWCCFNMKNGIFQTSFIIQSLNDHLWKISHHVLHNTGMHNSNDDFQHYCYCGNKSYNWKRCEFQNEKFEAVKQNILELRSDVTLQKNSKQRAKVYKSDKLWNIFWENP